MPLTPSDVQKVYNAEGLEPYIYMANQTIAKYFSDEEDYDDGFRTEMGSYLALHYWESVRLQKGITDRFIDNSQSSSSSVSDTGQYTRQELGDAEASGYTGGSRTSQTVINRSATSHYQNTFFGQLALELDRGGILLQESDVTPPKPKPQFFLAGG